MSKADEQNDRIKLIASTIEMLLQQVDLFTSEMTKDDFETMEQCKKAIKEKISINISAMPLIYACGGEYDSTEDEMKLKTLNALIDLMKARIEYKEELIKMQENSKKKQEVLKLFGLMGM